MNTTALFALRSRLGDKCIITVDPTRSNVIVVGETVETDCRRYEGFLISANVDDGTLSLCDIPDDWVINVSAAAVLDVEFTTEIQRDRAR